MEDFWDMVYRETAEKNAKGSADSEARMAAESRETVFDRGFRLGWDDAEGNSLITPEDEDDEEGLD